MATTAIWDVKGWLGKVVVYIENPDKTENPDYFEKQGMTDKEAQGLSDVIDYALRDDKVRKKADIQNNATAMQYYVSGINCTPSTARDEMMSAKKRYGKDDGIVAFHGYQSFAPGEATPDIAHEIGIKMAKELWGDRFQVVVATHLDKSNHIHNHFVINSVSHVDGKRYNDCTATYMEMRKTSDRLCLEYGLSVIENPQRGKAKHYGEWKAEQENRPTWRGIVKADIDKAISESMTDRQFFDNLRKQGYEIKVGKDISVRPPGKERFVRLMRNFGEDYSIESINNRILAQSRPQYPFGKPTKQNRLIGIICAKRKTTGLRALYFQYLFKMGILPKKKEPSPKQVYFLFRDDIRKMDNINKEIKLLHSHRIDTIEQLLSFKIGVNHDIISLCVTRKHLRNKSRNIKDSDKLSAIKKEISVLSKKISALRKDVRLCENIEKRSVEIQEKLHTAAEFEMKNLNGKEKNTYEQFR